MVERARLWCHEHRRQGYEVRGGPVAVKTGERVHRLPDRDVADVRPGRDDDAGELI
jgi:hypothetical protein